MLSLEEIQEEIEKLENGQTTYSNCERLATLYIVRDHYGQSAVAQAEMVDLDEFSEFTRVSLSISREKLISVMNEHMEAIKLLYPKEYNIVIDKLKA